MAAANTAHSVGMIAAWYFANIGVILLNKYLLSVYGFRFPVFLTTCHMAMCALLSLIVRASGIAPRQSVKNRAHLRKIGVLGVIFVASVVAGNVSLQHIPVSFNQAIGATTPFFTAVLSLCIMRQKETMQVYATLVPIVLGIVVASRAEPLFHLFGFLACVTATFCRALKSVIQGMLLSNESERMDSINLLLYMSPIALSVLSVASTVMEPEAFGVFYDNCAESPRFFFIITLNCVLAFSVNLTNFLVTKCTSPLTLQVLGNAKGAVAVVVSILLFKNPVSVVGMFGYAVTIVGVAWYSSAKKKAPGDRRGKREGVGNSALGGGRMSEKV